MEKVLEATPPAAPRPLADAQTELAALHAEIASLKSDLAAIKKEMVMVRQGVGILLTRR